MFETAQQFFPTPHRVAATAWAKLRQLRRYPDKILDPNGGKGDLLRPCQDYSGTKYAIEIDPDLQTILREQGIIVLGSDFLTWNEPITFDAILMNPPYNKAVHHVLKAWDILDDGGAMVALVNVETLTNLCTSERSRLSLLIQRYGGWEDLGQCFRDAERKTDVAVAMLWMQKPERSPDPSEFRFSGEFRRADNETYEEFAQNPLARVDAVDNLVAQYNACLNVLRARHQAQTELKYHLSSLPPSGYSDEKDDFSRVGDFFEEVQMLKRRFWWAVFKMSRMSEIQTSCFQKKFDEFVEGQIAMAFDKSNILAALAAFFQNKEQIMIDSLVSVFDRATAYHESNVIHPEGWKSNSGWKINPKIVIPFGLVYSQFLNHWDLPYKSKNRTFLDDLDEVLCWLRGIRHDRKENTSNRIHYSDFQPNTWIECRFYDIKLFRKGTIHIRFHDLYILDDFNAIAARGKNWIGGEGY